MTARIGDWMEIHGGSILYPLDPRAEEYNIQMVAASLSKQCRYAGHCKGFYSVAEHSILVSYCVPIQDALEGLLHDATEAGCVDVPKPMKVGMPDYNAIEAKHWPAVVKAFKLQKELPKSVMQADVEVLLAEKEQIMWGLPWITKWTLGMKPAKVRIHRHHWRIARLRFLWRYRELTEGRGWYSLPLKLWLL